MDTTSLQKIKDVVLGNEDIAIAVGKNPNLDEMGAALGLYLALKSANKQVAIACPTEPLVEISSLIGIDKVKTNLDTTGGDLVVSFPYEEGEIEKVSYTLENGYLNIIVKAGEKGLSFAEKDVEYKRGGGEGVKVLFVVGTATLSNLGNLFDPEALKNTTVINIDNKSDNQGFGDVFLVSTSASSVSEQIANLISFLDFPIDIDIAQNLLSGISFATDNFQNQKTSPTAFEMAALFLKKGAVRIKATRQKAFLQDSTFPAQSPVVQPMQNPFPQRKSMPFGQTSQRDPFMQRDRNPFKAKMPQPFLRPQQPGQSLSRSNNPVPPPMIETKDDQPEETPPDWLAPKVYKGSTLV